MTYTSIFLSIINIFFLYTSLLHVDEYEYKKCTIENQGGDKCWLEIDDIIPGQFAVGFTEVLINKHSIERKTELERLEHKRRRHIPIHIAPNEKFYMYNHHHYVRGIYESNIPESEKWVFVVIKNNYKHLNSMNSFFKGLLQLGYIWLYDNKGNPNMDPNLLPGHIKDLENDIFRTLAGKVRSNGGFVGSSLPYIEFYWANYFRKQLDPYFQLYRIQTKDYKKWCAVRPYSSKCIYVETELISNLFLHAMDACLLPQARGLPGFKPPYVEYVYNVADNQDDWITLDENFERENEWLEQELINDPDMI